jgi:fumarate reductase flavoprotein subunit
MLREHCRGYDPETWFCTGLRHEGDGIRLAFALGAAPEGLGLCEFHAPSVQGPLFLSLALREPGALIVNGSGRRFLDESIVDNPFEAANALRRQPGQTAFAILDGPLRAHVLRKAANKARGPLYEDQMRDPEQFVRLLDGLKGRRGRTADSLDAIAEAIGCDAGTLEATVTRYNDACARGHDDAFGKPQRHLRPIAEPPFTVLRGTVGFFNTIGGVRVSEHLEVVDDADRPIAGLFAAGVDVGGWQGDTYNFHLAGGSLGFALSSGRIAGARAAAR